MSDAIFLSEFTEDAEFEAKLAQGRSGQGALPQDFWETYSAFANSHGGTVFLGVREEDREFFAEGIADPVKVEESLWSLLNDRNKVSHNLLDRQHVRHHRLANGRTVLIIQVPWPGRATTYTLDGLKTVDLAEIYNNSGRPAKAKLSEATSGISEATSSNNEGTSPEEPREKDSQVSRTHDLPPLEPSSALNQAEWRGLWEETREYRKEGTRMNPEVRRRLILHLCHERFLSKQELAQLLGMYAKGLRDRFLTPMRKEGLLHHRFPNIPNHEDQGYRAIKSDPASK